MFEKSVGEGRTVHLKNRDFEAALKDSICRLGKRKLNNQIIEAAEKWDFQSLQESELLTK